MYGGGCGALAWRRGGVGAPGVRLGWRGCLYTGFGAKVQQKESSVWTRYPLEMAYLFGNLLFQTRQDRRFFSPCVSV